MLTHLQVVSVPVSDQYRAKAFYVDTLGFELRDDEQFGPQQRRLEVAPKGSLTSITLVTWFPTIPALHAEGPPWRGEPSAGSVQGLVVATDDIEAAYRALKARGVTFSRDIQGAPWDGYATLEDPDGNGWVVTGPPQSG